MTDLDPDESLAAAFASSVALTDRYQQTFDSHDLDAAIDAWGALARHPVVATGAHPAALRDAWSNRAVLLVQRHFTGGRDADLDDALAAWERALDLVEPGAAPDLAVLSNYGAGLRVRYERDGLSADLQRMLEVSEEVVARTPPGDPELPGRLSNLGVGLETRYARDGRPDDLRRAMQLYGDVLGGTPPAHPERPGFLSNFARAASLLYERTGEPDDLDSAVAGYSEAVATSPLRHPERPDFLAGLGTVLRLRYQRTGQAEILQRCIAAYEAALALLDPGAPRRTDCLDGMGSALRNRYYHTGDLTDLDRSVAAYGEALVEAPTDAPRRAVHLQNLGLALQDRFSRTRYVGDLAGAVAAHEESVRCTPAGAPDRAGRLANLANALLERFEHAADPRDLDRALALADEAVTTEQGEAAPLLHGTRGAAHMRRFLLAGDVADLNTAIDAFREALAGLPAGSPRAVVFGNNLAVGLSRRSAVSGDPEDRRLAGAVFRQAVTEGLALWPEWALMAARSWGGWAVDDQAWAEAAEAFTAAMTALRALVATQLRREHQEQWLVEVQLLPDRAADASARAGDRRAGVALLESGRALLLADRLQRDFADLDGLAALGRADLADRYRAAAARWRDLQSGSDERHDRAVRADVGDEV